VPASFVAEYVALRAANDDRFHERRGCRLEPADDRAVAAAAADDDATRWKICRTDLVDVFVDDVSPVAFGFAVSVTGGAFSFVSQCGFHPTI
jgi:hypothetical protein